MKKSPAASEFAVKDPLPGAKVQTAVDDSNCNFAAHDLPGQVRVGAIFSSAVVLVLADWTRLSRAHLPRYNQRILDEFIDRQAVVVAVGQDDRGDIQIQKEAHQTAYPWKSTAMSNHTMILKPPVEKAVRILDPLCQLHLTCQQQLGRLGAEQAVSQ